MRSLPLRSLSLTKPLPLRCCTLTRLKGLPLRSCSSSQFLRYIYVGLTYWSIPIYAHSSSCASWSTSLATTTSFLCASRSTFSSSPLEPHPLVTVASYVCATRSTLSASSSRLSIHIYAAFITHVSLLWRYHPWRFEEYISMIRGNPKLSTQQVTVRTMQLSVHIYAASTAPHLHRRHLLVRYEEYIVGILSPYR